MGVFDVPVHPGKSLFLFVCIFIFAHRAWSQNAADDLESKYETLLDHEIKSQLKNRNQFLALAALGQKLSIEGNYNESNQCLERAYLLLIDHPNGRRKINEKCYEDDHDLFMVLYFKTMNYLSLGLIDDALVECRGMDEWLQSDQRLGRKLVAMDPLVYVVMGLVYEASGDFENAAISFRRAKNLFDQAYKGSFYRRAPQQLEADLRDVSLAAGRQASNNTYGELIFGTMANVPSRSIRKAILK